MNERIRQLAEQAESIRLKYDQATMKTERIQEFDKQKFAELIVRECVQQLDRNVAYEILCSDEMPPKDNHWEGFVSENIVNTLSNHIKKHFGVAE